MAFVRSAAVSVVVMVLALSDGVEVEVRPAGSQL